METDEDFDADDLIFLYGDPEDVEEMMEAGPPVTPLDYGAASWMAAMAHAAELRADQANQELVRLELIIAKRREEVVGPARRQADWWDQGVQAWHRAALAAGEPVGKSITFACGRKSNLRARPPAIAGKPDHGQLQAYAEERGWSGVYKRVAPEDAFRSRELLKHVTIVRGTEPGSVAAAIDPETGEKVPGVLFVEQQDSWSNGSSKRKRGKTHGTDQG